MNGKPFQIRFFGIMAIITATVVLMYGAMFRGDPEVTFILIISVMFATVGLTFGILMTGVSLRFHDLSIIETLLWGGASFGAIYIVNRYVPIQFLAVTSAISQKWLGVLVGISEELFFRVFLCGVASKFSKWGAIIGSSVIWSAYHISRYGGNWNVYWIIFPVGLFLGWVYLTSRLGDGVIYAHALVNYQTVP